MPELNLKFCCIECGDYLIVELPGENRPLDCSLVVYPCLRCLQEQHDLGWDSGHDAASEEFL